MPFTRWNVARRRRRRMWPRPPQQARWRPGWGCRLQRPELVHADDLLRIIEPTLALAIGERVQVEHPLLLGLIIGVGRLFPGLYALKGHALLAQHRAQPLMADVVDHPLIDLIVGKLRQAPGRERLPVILRPRPRDPLDLIALSFGELSAGDRPYSARTATRKASALKLWSSPPPDPRW
jgi:hypothetical protein